MFPQVFGVVSYSIWRALPIIYINTVSTLIYTFGDLIVFSISLALSNYFKIYNAQVFALKHKDLTLKEWRRLRYRYMKLCELVYEVDDCLCHLLCLTFLMHLYILCVEINQGML
ncbi:gustatory receptor for sugar taste 64e-like [Planococcus citri]|uniref:gustatory receptor for sugar taste 64e-like n=1 Tax=Planococcus citri TaxID=170843 RepID=UPI0031F7A88E